MNAARQLPSWVLAGAGAPVCAACGGMTGVGKASFFTTPADDKGYITVVDGGYDALMRDVHNYVAFADPDALEAAAKDFDAAWPDKAADLRKQAVQARANMAGKTPSQITMERTWAAAWNDQYTEWQKLKLEVNYPEMNGSFSGSETKWMDLWNRIEEMQTALDSWYVTYKKLTDRDPTTPPPAHPAPGGGTPNPPSNIPWVPIIWIAAIGITIYGVSLVLPYVRAALPAKA